MINNIICLFFIIDCQMTEISVMYDIQVDYKGLDWMFNVVVYPSKPETLKQCWLHVGPASWTVDQR